MALDTGSSGKTGDGGGGGGTLGTGNGGAASMGVRGIGGALGLGGALGGGGMDGGGGATTSGTTACPTVILAVASTLTPTANEMAAGGCATRAVAAAATREAVVVAVDALLLFVPGPTLLAAVDASGMVRMAVTATLAAETRRVRKQSGS